MNNSSQLILCDKNIYENETYCYTYYHELNKKSVVIFTLKYFALILLFAVSIIINLTTIICTLRYPAKKSITGFILIMAIADITFVSTIPLFVYMERIDNWKIAEISCGLLPYSQLVSSLVLLWTLALISIERHNCIVNPPYKSNLTRKKAHITLLRIWFIAIVMFFPIVYWLRHRKLDLTEHVVVCTLILPKTTLLYFWIISLLPIYLLASITPIVIHVYNYLRILKRIISTRNTWAASCVGVSIIDVNGRRQSEISLSEILAPWPRRMSIGNQQRRGSISMQEESRIRKRVKVVRILTFNIVFVLISWLPFEIIILLILTDKIKKDNSNCFEQSPWFFVSLILIYLNTLINPILYGFTSDNVRVNVFSLICCKKNLQLNNNNDNNNVNEYPTTSINRSRLNCRTQNKDSIIELENENSNVNENSKSNEKSYVTKKC